jgi:hypothetical protein
VDDTLHYAQRRLYALQLGAQHMPTSEGMDHTVRLNVADVFDQFDGHMLMGTYVVAEHRIRDTVHIDGPRVLTFAGPLKYDQFPLAQIIAFLLKMGETAMGIPVEMEFAMNLSTSSQGPAHFNVVQMRPMTARNSATTVDIHSEEVARAFCYTRRAIGNTQRQRIEDIVYIKPESFDPGRMQEMTTQVAALNAMLETQQRQYILVGPGRWGSADPWLGIPVRWADISSVAAVVETVSPSLHVEPSQGDHFFHNLVSMGVSYFSMSSAAPDHVDWDWLTRQAASKETEHVTHVRLKDPLAIKVDGRSAQGVIFVSS